MEININFSVPASASASEICSILARVMVDIALNDADGSFAWEHYEVSHNGECIATYSVLAEPDAEDSTHGWLGLPDDGHPARHRDHLWHDTGQRDRIDRSPEHHDGPGDLRRHGRQSVISLALT